MFEVKERQTFLDLLKPPAGYRLDAAIGTTYSLDFIALTAALLAFVDAEYEQDQMVVRHVEALQAITRLADRIGVYVNRGRVVGPDLVNKATVLYDRIVHEVSLPEGCFHPKVWMMRYLPRMIPGAGKLPPVFRVICSSRNLTTSQNWEAFIAFEGKEEKGGKEQPLVKGLKTFIRRLSDTETTTNPLFDKILESLSHTKFDLPQDDVSFLWQWQDVQDLVRHLPSQGNRALIVSPFVRKTFLEKILQRFRQVTLISTQGELDAIEDQAFINRLCGAKNRVYVVVPGDTEDTEPLMDLHAKVMVFEGDNGKSTFLGSANATPSAWEGKNCEAMVRVSPGVSIDHFCNRFVFGEEAAQLSHGRPLQGWINLYQRQSLSIKEKDTAQKQLDAICEEIARLDIHAAYDPTSRSLKVLLKGIPAGLADKFIIWSSFCTIQIALLSQLHSNAALRPAQDLFKEGFLVFDNIEVGDLTYFLVVDITIRHQPVHKRFILKIRADFDQWRDQRDAYLIQQLLTRDDLHAFLRAILFDTSARFPSKPEDIQGINKGSGSGESTLFSDISIEDVIRSCTEDPSRIEEINKALKIFEKTGWIDEAFMHFWSVFVLAEIEARKELVHG